jgi:hypothetical protein
MARHLAGEAAERLGNVRLEDIDPPLHAWLAQRGPSLC